jgi:hypothetical protein
MTDALALHAHALPQMTAEQVSAARALETVLLEREQVELLMEHLFHGGMYARTIAVPAGVALTGVLIKRATTVIISGDITVYVGADCERLTGYHVLPGSAGPQAGVRHARADAHHHAFSHSRDHVLPRQKPNSPTKPPCSFTATSASSSRESNDVRIFRSRGSRRRSRRGRCERLYRAVSR